MDNQNRKLELLGNAPIPKALLSRYAWYFISLIVSTSVLDFII